MRQRWTIVAWLAPIAIMLVLVTSNVRLAANSLTLYEALFERNNVEQRTGITKEGLRDVGQQVQEYFRSDEEPLIVTAEVAGIPRSLFTPEEAAHMADVKQLFLKTYRVQAASALFLALVALIAVFSLRGRAYAAVGRWLWHGGLLTVGVILTVGLASVVAFDEVFLLFHQLGFPQGNFLFDPRVYFLTRVFPQGFWFDITLFIALLSLAEAAALVAVGWLAVRPLRRRTS